MCQLFWLTVNPTHLFDEYDNFRRFKVSFKDTRTIVLLLTLIRFHAGYLEDWNNGWGATYLIFSE